MKLKELSKALHDRPLMIFVFDILFLFLPGVLFLAVEFRELFLSTNWIILTLLSGSITLFPAFINMLIIDANTVVDEKGAKQDDDENFFRSISLGIISAGFGIYAILFLVYVSQHFSQFWYMSSPVLDAVIFEVLLVIVIVYDGWIEKRALRKKSTK